MRERNMRKAVVSVLLSVACFVAICERSEAQGEYLRIAEWKRGYLAPDVGASFTYQPSISAAASLGLLVEGRFDSVRIYLDFWENANRAIRTDSLTLQSATGDSAYIFRQWYPVPFLATSGANNTVHFDGNLFQGVTCRLYNLALQDSTLDSLRCVLFGRTK